MRASGREALEALSKNGVDVLLTDLHMGEMAGHNDERGRKINPRLHAVY